MGLCSNTECERFTIEDHLKGWRPCADDEFCMSHHSLSFIPIQTAEVTRSRMDARWEEAIRSYREVPLATTASDRIIDIEREIENLRTTVRSLQQALADLTQAT